MSETETAHPLTPYASALSELHALWTPHPGQVRIGAPLIQGQTNDVFAQCGRNFGKALSLDTKLPTPDGFTTIGEVRVGDELFDETGNICLVTQVHPILLNQKVYKVTFSDGTEIKACENHRWLTWDKAARKSERRAKNAKKPQVRKTSEIARTLRAGKEYNHSVQNTQPIIGGGTLPIPPYVLGLWLGDGSHMDGRVSKPYKEVWDRVAQCGFKYSAYDEKEHCILGLVQKLRPLGVLGNKHIPTQYLRAGIENRLELLRGLLDSDGHCRKGSLVEFSNKRKVLADGVFELAASLGFRPYRSEKRAKLNGKDYGISHGVRFAGNGKLFYIQHKQKNISESYKRRNHRTIVSCEEIQTEPVRCITVDSKSSLYLCTDAFIPTHNTELVCYLLWRYAQTNPGSENYYFAPYMKQAREIVWASRRMQTFGPTAWIDEPNNSELRILFKNGSFIKLDGSDNDQAYRGIKPKGLTVYDEFKDFRPEFHEAYDPNRAAYESPLLIIGTPPEAEGQFTQVAKEFQLNPQKRFFQAPTRDNPHISRAWLEKKRQELILKGEYDVWEREYEAKFVRGGASKIFPMLKDSHRQPHSQVINTILRDRRKLHYFMWADPAAASVFAVLFAAVNPYTKVWYFLDEIYETNQSLMTVQQIGKRMLAMKKELTPDPRIEWRQGYDEAETWFQSEMLDHFGEHFEPTHKMKSDKITGIGLIKDALLQDRVVISDRCENLWKELENYRKDKNGKIVKEADHLIDNMRYILSAEHYSTIEEREPRKDPDARNFVRIKDEFAEFDESGQYIGSEWERV